MSTTDTIFTAATTADAKLLSSVGRTSFAEAFGHLFDAASLEAYLHKTFNEDKMRASLKKPTNHFFLIQQKQHTVGYIKLKENSCNDNVTAPHQWQLQKLYILNAYIGQKIGSNALSFIIDYCKPHAPLEMWLAVVYENIRAKRFYERHGFTVCGQYQHEFDVGVMDFHVMRLEIAK